MKKLIITLAILGLAFPAYAIDTVKKATVFHPISGDRKAVIVGDKHAFDGGYLLEVARVVNKGKKLGYSVATSYSTTLSASTNSTQSTIPVSSMSTKDSHTLTMADFGSKVFLVIEPGASKEEIIMCTGISSTNWTGCTRGLAFYGTSTASIVANRHAHNSGAKVIMSNTHYVYDELVDKDATDTIAGNKTFTGTTTFYGLPSLNSYIAPTSNGDLAAKKYVDDTAIAGAPAALPGTAGIGKVSTKAQASAGTSGDGTYSYFLPSSIATSSSDIATTSLVITKTNGKIAQNFLDLTENYSFSGSFTLSSTTSSTYPTASSSIATKGYSDSLSYLSFKTGTTTHTLADTGAQTIAHGLGRVPKMIKINTNVYIAYNSGYLTSRGAYNGTTQWCLGESSLISSAWAGMDSSNIIYLVVTHSNGTPSAYAKASISVDATNITLTWTNNSNPSGAANIAWEAY